MSAPRCQRSHTGVVVKFGRACRPRHPPTLTTTNTSLQTDVALPLFFVKMIPIGEESLARDGVEGQDDIVKWEEWAW